MPDPPPEDEVYELSDDDALPDGDDDGLYELAEADEPEPATTAKPIQTPVEELDADGHTYALGETSANPRRGDLKILEHPPRYCLACGCDLTLVEDEVCPRCEKPFDPQDPKTFSDEPIKEPGNWWLQPPRLAGYALIGFFLIGRMVIHAIAGGFDGMTNSIGGAFLVPAMIVFLLLPWIIAGVMLSLTGVSEHFNPKVAIAVPMGVGFGLLLTLGLHPALIFIGLVVGGFAGFVYAWRAA